MSGNQRLSDKEQSQNTKYTTDLSADDPEVESLEDEEEEAQVVDVTDDVEPTGEVAEEKAPEQNENADYEFGPMPNTFTMAVNPAAWHPSWGPAPAGYDLIVSRTQSEMSANTDMKVGETDDGQSMKQGVRAIKKGNYTNTPDGMGATVGSGWTYTIPDWQLMERELAGDGVDLSGSGVARLEAATAEQREEEERRARLPSQDDVFEHYEPEPTMDDESDVMTLWDEADDDTLEDVESILGETGEQQTEPMSMMDAWDEVREYTLECAGQRAQESREAVANADITNGQQPAFDFFNDDGNRTLVARQAGQRSPDHRPFDTDFMRARPLGGHYPKWGSWSPETKEVEVPFDQTIEVADDPIAPIPDDHLEWAREKAQKFLLSESLLDDVESGTMRLFDRNAECAGLSTEETYFADQSDEVETGGEHPAAAGRSGPDVAPDGSIRASAAASALGVPSVRRTRDAYENALADEQDSIAAFGPAMEALWHGDATQSFDRISGDWPGCTVIARVTRAYVPNAPDSQQQVLYLEDIAPNVSEPGQMGGEVKLTVWRKSQIETFAAVGDVLFISNPKPGEFRGDLTLAATGDTTIDRFMKSDGDIKDFKDARGKMTGRNDGKQRPHPDNMAPTSGGEIVEADDVTKIHEKRYRRVARTYKQGPPEDDKNTRMGRPMVEQNCPMEWVHPIPEWSNPEIPEETLGRDTRAERFSTTSEPSEILDENSVDISVEEFTLTLNHLDADLARVTDDAVDVGASVSIHGAPDDIGGDEVVGVVEHHPHAPDHLEVRVHSGITIDPDEENSTIRVVEWDTEADEAVDFGSPVTHTYGWGARMKRKVRAMRDKHFDAEKPHPVAMTDPTGSTGKQVGGVDVVDVTAPSSDDAEHDSDDPEWQSRLILRNSEEHYECPVDTCDFTHPTKRGAVASHMGGKAESCDDHAATLNEAKPSNDSSADDDSDSASHVTGQSDDGTDIVDVSAL